MNTTSRVRRLTWAGLTTAGVAAAGITGYLAGTGITDASATPGDGGASQPFSAEADAGHAGSVDRHDEHGRAESDGGFQRVAPVAPDRENTGGGAAPSGSTQPGGGQQGGGQQGAGGAPQATTRAS